MKTKYLNAQKKILENIPVNPFELTAAGIAELKRNIIVSIVSFAACMIMSLIVLRWTFSSEGMASDGHVFEISYLFNAAFHLFVFYE